MEIILVPNNNNTGNFIVYARDLLLETQIIIYFE